MTPNLLRTIGEALYGTSWQGGLAADLEIDARNLRRWVAGGREMPEEYRERLRVLVSERQALLEHLAQEISGSEG